MLACCLSLPPDSPWQEESQPVGDEGRGVGRAEFGGGIWGPGPSAHAHASHRTPRNSRSTWRAPSTSSGSGRSSTRTRPASCRSCPCLRTSWTKSESELVAAGSTVGGAWCWGSLHSLSAMSSTSRSSCFELEPRHPVPLSFREPPSQRWCHTCQANYTGDLIQHRRTKEHKVEVPFYHSCYQQAGVWEEGSQAVCGVSAYQVFLTAGPHTQVCFQCCFLGFQSPSDPHGQGTTSPSLGVWVPSQLLSGVGVLSVLI